MYFSQWQRGKKKSLCKTQRRKQGWLPRGLGRLELTVCPPGRPPSSVKPLKYCLWWSETHGEFLEELGFLPNSLNGKHQCNLPFLCRKLPRSRSPVLWESLKKCKKVSLLTIYFRKVASNIPWTLINPKPLLGLWGAPLLCPPPPRPSPTSSPVTMPWFSHSWNPRFLSALQRAKLTPASRRLRLLSPVPGTHFPSTFVRLAPSRRIISA